MKVLSGKIVKESIDKKILEYRSTSKKVEKMVSIRVGEDYGSIYYEKSLIKKAESLQVVYETLVFDENISTHELILEIQKLNADIEVAGILVFFPLPKSIDAKVIKSVIASEKDIDCINPLNEAKIYSNDNPTFYPATALAVIKMCEYYNIDLCGKNVLIIGRSTVVGKPLSMMALALNATVTVAHSKTNNLKEVAQNADIVIVAIGKAHFVDRGYVGDEKQIFIDVGINRLDGKTVGDINYTDLENNVAALTPVPNGVGSITSSLMFAQCLGIK